MRPIGYRFAALPLVFDEGTARERHVQRVSKIEGNEHLVLDFLLERAAFAGLLANPVEIVLPEGPLGVVPREVLLAMKRLAGRHQDLPTWRSWKRALGKAARRTAGHPPPGVPERLERLRSLYVAESDAAARRRLAAEHAPRPERFAAAVARRLAELRALDDLAAHLHPRRRRCD